jgi:hypothetical protein
MISIETIPGIREGGIKVNDGEVNSNMIYLIYCKNFCKCHNVPPPNTAIKKLKIKKIKITSIKWTGGMTQVVEHQPCKHKVLNSNPSYTTN